MVNGSFKATTAAQDQALTRTLDIYVGDNGAQAAVANRLERNFELTSFPNPFSNGATITYVLED